MKFSYYIILIGLLYSCKNDDKPKLQTTNCDLFEINKIQTDIRDSLDVDIKKYISKIENDIRLSYLRDTVLEKAKNGEIDTFFRNKVYSTNFQEHKIIEDTTKSRLVISKFIILSILNSTNLNDTNCLNSKKQILDKIKSASLDNFFLMDRYSDSYFESLIYDIDTEFKLSKSELLNLLFIRYLLLEINKCSWCDNYIK